MFQWMFSDMFQRKFISQWYWQKDLNLSSGLLLEMANGHSLELPNDISRL